jgi:hypothetical protein
VVLASGFPTRLPSPLWLSGTLCSKLASTVHASPSSTLEFDRWFLSPTASPLKLKEDFRLTHTLKLTDKIIGLLPFVFFVYLAISTEPANLMYWT